MSVNETPGLLTFGILFVLVSLSACVSSVSHQQSYPTATMVENTTQKKLRRMTWRRNLKTPSGISDDWDLIDYMLENSNLPHLRLQDIVRNLDSQKAWVQNIEPVVRLDHLHSFLNSVVKLEAGITDPYRGWDIVFHGTLRSNVTSIIQHGFRLPGQGKHTSRFQSDWGPGIYCSPFGTYSYPYGHQWDKTSQIMLDPERCVTIFVCAVARGKPFQCDVAKITKYTGLEEGFDSHISHDQCEWIVFDRQRIVPLCLLWITRGRKEWFWETHERVEPGKAHESVLRGLRSPKEYQCQALRDGMEYNGINSGALREKVKEIFRLRKDRIS